MILITLLIHNPPFVTSNPSGECNWHLSLMNIYIHSYDNLDSPDSPDSRDSRDNPDNPHEYLYSFL